MKNRWFRLPVVSLMYVVYVSVYVTGCGLGRPEDGESVRQKRAAVSVVFQPPPAPRVRVAINEGTVALSAGAMSVTSTGESTWSMPLDLLPGRNGLAPGLAITYRSRAGDGILGRGFGLQGLSVISRCWSTAADSGRAGVGSEAGLAPNFCLNGARLFPRDASEPNELSPEMDRSTLVRVTGELSTPESFTVLTADGRIAYFGSRSAANSKLTGNALAIDGERLAPDGPFATDNLRNVSGTERTITWFLDRVTDRYQNYIDYNYSIDVDPNTGAQEVLIASIGWTGNSDSRNPLDPQRKVEFKYQSNYNSRSGFSQGLSVKQSSLLESISIIGPDGLNSTSKNKSSPMWTYQFGYMKDPNGRAIVKLESISKCLPSGACAEPLKVQWLGNATPLTPKFKAQTARSGTDFFDDQGPNSSALYDTYDLSVGDLNGDGRDDVLYRVPLVQNGAAFYTTVNVQGPGGFTDYRLVASSQWRVRLGGSTGLGSPIAVTGLPPVTEPGWFNSPRLVDSDRDGKVEVLIYDHHAQSGVVTNYDLLVFNGSGFTPRGSTALETLTAPYTCYEHAEYNAQCWVRRGWPVALGDIDGDGTLDLLRDTDPLWNGSPSASTSIGVRPGLGPTIETVQELVPGPGVSHTKSLEVFPGAERLMFDTDGNGQSDLITDYYQNVPDPARVDQFLGGPAPQTSWTLSSFSMVPNSGFVTGALQATQTALPAGPLELNSGSSRPSLAEAAFGTCSGDLRGTQRTPFSRLTGDFNGDGLRDVLSLPSRFSTDCGCVIGAFGAISCSTVVDYSSRVFRNLNAGSTFAAAETIPNFITAPSTTFSSQAIPGIFDISKATDPRPRYRGVSRTLDNGLRTVDLDRDGRDDVVQVSALTFPSAPVDSMRWFRSDGDQFVERSLGIPLADPLALKYSSWSGFGGAGPVMTQFGDFNGDGYIDIVSMDTSSVFAYLQETPKPDVVVEISSTHSAGTVVDYDLGLSNASSSSPYKLTPSCSAQSPHACVRNLGWVVSNLHLPGGVVERHQYEDAVDDTRGRGRLGVRAHIVDTFDPAGSVVQTVRDSYDLSSSASAVFAWVLPFTTTFHTVNTQLDVPSTRLITNPEQVTEIKTTSVLGLGGDGHSEVGSFSLKRRVSVATTRDRAHGLVLSSRRTVTDYDEFRNLTSRTVTTSDEELTGTASSQNLTKVGDWEEVTNRFAGANYVCLNGGACGEGWLVSRYRKLIKESSAARLGSGSDVASVETTFTYEPTSPDVETATSDVPSYRQRPGSEYALTVTIDRDDRGAVTSVTQSAPTPANGVISSPLSRATTFTFDSNDEEFIFPANEIGPLGHQRNTYRFAATGSPVALDEVNGARTEFDYDELFRQVVVNPPVGKTIKTEFGARDPDTAYVLQSVGAQETETTFNRLGQQIHRRQAGTLNESEQLIEYDAFGRVSGRSLPYVSPRFGPANPPMIRFGYDLIGRIIEVSRPGETLQAARFKKTVAYEGRKTTATSERGMITETNRDARGRDQDVTVIDPVSHETFTTRYSYWHFGLPSQIEHPRNGNRGQVVSQMFYDDLGRRTELLDPDTGRELTYFSAFGELIGSEDGNGAPTTRTFDDLSRLLTETTPITSDYETLDRSNPYSRNNLFEYDLTADGFGQLARATSLAPDSSGAAFAGAVQVDYGYDSFGRLTTQAWQESGNTYEIDLGYDSEAALYSVTYPEFGGERVKVHYDHDTDFSTTGVYRIDRSGTKTPIWRLQSQNVAGQSTEELFGQSTLSVHRFDASFALRYMETVSANASGGPAAQRVSYTWGADQFLSGRFDLDLGSDESYTHDAVGRLVQWKTDQNCVSTTWEYDYDEAGNLNSKKLQVGTSPQTTWAAYSYDVAGPHQVSQLTIDGVTVDYSYLAGGQMERSSSKSFSWTPFGLPWRVNNTTFVYDAFGQRIVKEEKGERTITIGGLFELRPDPNAASGISATFNFYGRDGVVAQLTRELDGSGRAVDLQTKYLHKDHLGNADSVTSEVGGAVVVLERGKYEPFGERRSPWALAHPIRQAHTAPASYGFTGHEPDETLGLTNMKGRLYDARLSRFLSADPNSDGSSQSLNRYSYVRNSPIDRVDPTGLEDTTAEPSIPLIGICRNLTTGSSACADAPSPRQTNEQPSGSTTGAASSSSPPSASGDSGTDPAEPTIEAASYELGTMTYWENTWYLHKLYFTFESRRLYAFNDELEDRNSNLGTTAIQGIQGILVPGSALPSERTLWGIGHSIKRNIETLGEYSDDNRDGFDAVFSGLAIVGLTAALVAAVVPELGPEEVLASELDVVSKGSRAWKAAVKALKKGGDRSVNIRVPDQRTARELIEEARPGIPRIRSYNGSQDGFGFEYHLKDEVLRAPANDLRHIKWYDYRKGAGDRRGQGHIYFDDWW